MQLKELTVWWQQRRIARGGACRVRVGRHPRALRGARRGLDAGAEALTRNDPDGPGDRPGRSVVLWQSDPMARDHAHSAAAAHRGRLTAVFAVTVAVLVVELVGAALSGMALLADAGHVLADGAGIGLALLAIRFAARPATPQRTFGYYRLEILAAVVNAVLLFGVAGFVLVEAVAAPDRAAGGGQRADAGRGRRRAGRQRGLDVAAARRPAGQA